MRKAAAFSDELLLVEMPIRWKPLPPLTPIAIKGFFFAQERKNGGKTSLRPKAPIPPGRYQAIDDPPAETSAKIFGAHCTETVLELVNWVFRPNPKGQGEMDAEGLSA